MFIPFKKSVYAYVLGYKDYRDEIQDFSAHVQRQYSFRLMVVFLVYILFMIISGIAYDRSFDGRVLYIFIPAAILFLHWLVFRLGVPQKQHKVILAGNVFLIVFLQVMEFAYDLSGGLLSPTLLISVYVSTSIVSLNPIHYVAVLIVSQFSHLLLDLCVIQGITGSTIAYLTNDLVILVISAQINILLSQLRYRWLKEKSSLQKESMVDELTGLYKRKYFQQFYSKYADINYMGAMLHIDLDNFKACNDAFGHSVGDEVLCQAADILKSTFRGTDCIARVGGDEFMVYMVNVTDKEPVMDKVKSLLAKFPIAKEDDSRCVAVSASIGVSFSTPGQYSCYEDMYINADSAMYQSKKAGKGRIAVFGEGVLS